jgi:hypothetical protein
LGSKLEVDPFQCCPGSDCDLLGFQAVGGAACRCIPLVLIGIRLAAALNMGPEIVVPGREGITHVVP